MDAHTLVNLPPLMRLSGGNPQIVVGIIDGPVALELAHLAGVRNKSPGTIVPCLRNDATACVHGTLVAGLLFANRDSATPGICPDCTLLTAPVFADAGGDAPLASQHVLAAAIVNAIEAGVRILNISAALTQPGSQGEQSLIDALDLAAARGVIVIAAAGNQRVLGSSVITRHPWVIPVAACDRDGLPLDGSNFGASTGRRGLLAPGAGVTAIGSDAQPRLFTGTSAAAPFVTGTAALLWSLFPRSTAPQVLHALVRPESRRTVIPPLLDSWSSYNILARRM